MKYPTLASLILFLFLIACEAPEMPLPSATGKAGEMIVVMKDSAWEGHLGDTVFHTLAADVYGLPQQEPEFNLVHIKNSAFSNIFRTHRNVVIFSINDTLKEAVELRKNIWAKPQTVVEIKGPDVKTVEAVFLKRADKILGHFKISEKERTLTSYRAQKNEEVVTAIKNDLGIQMDIPHGYQLVRSEPDFKWIRYQTKDITQSILIYTEPYTRDSTFTSNGMIEVMNLFSQRFIAGPTEGSYMKVYQDYPARFTETTLAGKYATELRGLWNLENGIMGGSFVCLAFLDEANNRVIYLHGFLFSPGKDKRNYMRQLEAIISGVKLTGAAP